MFSNGKKQIALKYDEHNIKSKTTRESKIKPIHKPYKSVTLIDFYKHETERSSDIDFNKTIKSAVNSSRSAILEGQSINQE